MAKKYLNLTTGEMTPCLAVNKNNCHVHNHNGATITAGASQTPTNVPNPYKPEGIKPLTCKKCGYIYDNKNPRTFETQVMLCTDCFKEESPETDTTDEYSVPEWWKNSYGKSNRSYWD